MCSGNAKSTGMPTPPKESLKVCKAASLSSCSTRMQAAQETQRCAHAQAAFGLLCAVLGVACGLCLLGIAGN